MSAASPSPAPLERLLRHVADDALDELRRAADRARREALEALEAAERRAEELERAARRLGAVRGGAVATAERQAVEMQARALTAGALEALEERFLARVRQALAALPGTPRHAAALKAWARQAAARASGPVDVFVEAGLRPAVYEALLEAGLTDLRVQADPRVRVGFVVRDLDGRTVLDRRPEALVEERRAELAALLRERLPVPPP